MHGIAWDEIFHGLFNLVGKIYESGELTICCKKSFVVMIPKKKVAWFLSDTTCFI